MSMIRDLRIAWPLHKEQALAAFALFKSYCAIPLPAVPGMDTPSRLALRIFYKGCTVEECAAREYLYRWHLAILNQFSILVSMADSMSPLILLANVTDLEWGILRSPTSRVAQSASRLCLRMVPAHSFLTLGVNHKHRTPPLARRQHDMGYSAR